MTTTMKHMGSGLLLLALGTALACSDSDGGSDGASGGRGGATDTGGSSGGATDTGGSGGSGGSTDTGGSAGVGGSTDTGGSAGDVSGGSGGSSGSGGAGAGAGGTSGGAGGAGGSGGMAGGGGGCAVTPDPCLNGGTCVAAAGDGYACECTAEWAGDDCGLPRFESIDAGWITRVSADGSAVIGQHASMVAGFRQRSGEGLELMDPPEGFTSTTVNATSRDGAVVVGATTGSSGSAIAARWTAGNAGQVLGVLAGDATSTATLVNHDGSVVFGTSGDGTTQRGFVWTAAGGIVALGDQAQGPTVNLIAASDDGSVVIGNVVEMTGVNRGFVWTTRGGTSLQVLTPLTGDEYVSLKALSGNGAVMIGLSGTIAAGTSRTVRWTSPANGVEFDVGWTTGCGPIPNCIGVNEDGSALFGQRGQLPVRWTAQEGVVELEGSAATANCAAHRALSGARVLGICYGPPLPVVWGSSSDPAPTPLGALLEAEGVDTQGALPVALPAMAPVPLVGSSANGDVIVGNHRVGTENLRGWIVRRP